MELPEKRKRRRSKRKFLDVVKEDWRKLVQGRRTLKTGCFGETSYIVATLDQRERLKEKEESKQWIKSIKEFAIRI